VASLFFHIRLGALPTRFIRFCRTTATGTGLISQHRIYPTAQFCFYPSGIRAAAKCYTNTSRTRHSRNLPGDPIGLVHVSHLNASAMGGVHIFLDLIAKAQSDGADITTEAYPYNAGSTSIFAALFSSAWQSIFSKTYKDIDWTSYGRALHCKRPAL
jgi:hypothetical protein